MALRRLLPSPTTEDLPAVPTPPTLREEAHRLGASMEQIMIHPIIQRFEAQAQLLDLRDSPDSLDDAIARLAGWMELAAERLREDDLAVLTEVGGVLYREGLRSRQAQRRP